MYGLQYRTKERLIIFIHRNNKQSQA